MASGINLKISADASQARSELDSLGGATQGVSKRTKVMGAALLGVAAATATAMKAAINYGDYLEKTAQKVGISTEALSAYKLGAELAGTSQDKLVSGLQRLQKGMGEAIATPTSRTAKAFEALGLAVTDSEGNLRNVEDLMVDFAGVMSKLPDGTAKTAIAMDLMGRSGAELIPFLNQGAEGLENMKVEAERLGIVWDEKSAKSAANFNDELSLMKANLSGFIQTATRYWLPALEKIAKAVNTFSRDMSGETEREIEEEYQAGKLKQRINAAREESERQRKNFEFNLQMAKEFAEERGEIFLEGEGLKELRTMVEAEEAAYKRLFEELGKEAGFTTEEMEKEIAKMKALAGEILALAAYKPPEKDEDGDGNGKPKGKGRGRRHRYGGTKAKTPEQQAREDAQRTAKAQRAADARALQSFQDHLRSENEALRDELQERYAMIKRNLDSGELEQGEARELALAAQREYTDEIKRMRDELDEDEKQRRRESDDRAKEDKAKKLQDAQELFAAQQQLAHAAIGATEQFATMMIDAVAGSYKEGTKEQKAAAKAAFVVTKAAALAGAIVNMAGAMNAGLNTMPFLPLGPIMMATAGILGATSIATIMASTIKGVADAGLPPGALRAAGLNRHTTIAVRNDEMVLDPVGTSAISEMLKERSANQPVNVNTVLEIDGNVLGQTVDTHLIRSKERGLAYSDRERYGAR